MIPRETLPESESHPTAGVEQKVIAPRRYRVLVPPLYAHLVLVFGAGGILLWSGMLKPLRGPLGGILAYLISLPVALLTWPAHEYTLERMGPGAGANALTEVSVSATIIFAGWAALLWAPVLAAFWRKAPLWMVSLFQAVLLFAVFSLFWQYGNT
ncbi:MAG: hypothetical protein U9Q79_00405 [Candidatus Hydrogenedentes bacterium]|nr:hypothetical protein [Candidatus Hydrogenedentota bacterium]